MNPWRWSVLVTYGEAEHLTAARVTSVQALASDDQIQELENRVEGEPITVEASVSLPTLMTLVENTLIGIKNSRGEPLTAGDKMRFQARIEEWAEETCKGKFQILIHDVYRERDFIQFELEEDMRAYLARFGGDIRQPTKRERDERLSSVEIRRRMELAMKGDPEAVAWLHKPKTIVASSMTPVPPQTRTRR